MAITDWQILELQGEAAAAGDADHVLLCECALCGCEAARCVCADVIASATVQQ